MAARLLAVLVLLAPVAARADVPVHEGGGGRPFSVTVAAGAAVPSTAATRPSSRPGVFVEATAAWWASETFQAEVGGGWRGNDGGTELFGGLRARSGFWPMSVSAAVQVGVLRVPGQGSVALFVPRLGADLRLGPHALVGMGYAIDVRLDTLGIVHRVYLDLGWRF